MPSHFDDSTYDDAHQQLLKKDSFLFFFLLLVSHFVFLVHFKETNISAVHFPDSNQVQRTPPLHIFMVDIAPHDLTNHQYHHHAQAPPLEASLPHQCRCLSDRRMDDERPSHRMCSLGENRRNHRLRRLLLQEQASAMHESFFHFSSCHHD